VIADAYADPAFGTGVVKITPAHDPNDFEVGVRHKLPMPVVMTPEAEMAEFLDATGRVPVALRGLDRFAARKAIVQQLEAEGRLVKVEQHRHAVRHCYRCDSVVEPRLSDQWFVRMQPLAEPALRAVREGRVRILPERWEAVYVHWMENIRDWNISRQLWWGHRIPVFTCERCGHVGAYREDPPACPTCGGPVRQDEDVLDTWFSSWLWPISTLGWPEETPDLKAFFPGDLLVTAPEILFFWVARMIMSGYRFMGDAPFHTVYLHGTARDTQHRKMSKSLGNGIDPLDVVRLYGADALRYTIGASLGMGADATFDPDDLEKTFAPGRNFATKLWNIARYLLSNVGGDDVRPLAALDATRLTLVDRWILGRLDAAVRECDAALGPSKPPAGGRWPEADRRAGLRLNEYTETARRFVWDELAAWYLESVKPRLAPENADAADRDTARAVLVHVFDQALRLLHPIVPFVTEAIWQRIPLPDRADGEFLARAAWPRARGEEETRSSSDDALGTGFELVRGVVVAIRQVRSDYNIPGKPIDAVIVPRSDAARRVVVEQAALVASLTRATPVVAERAPQGAAAHAVLADGSEVVIPLAGLVDLEKECAKIRAELAGLEKQLAALEQRLANPSFVAKAKPEIVAAERQKLGDWQVRREQLAQKVKSLCGA
jgi:valyl-tRNA synthetase